MNREDAAFTLTCVVVAIVCSALIASGATHPLAFVIQFLSLALSAFGLLVYLAED